MWGTISEVSSSDAKISKLWRPARNLDPGVIFESNLDLLLLALTPTYLPSQPWMEDSTLLPELRPQTWLQKSHQRAKEDKHSWDFGSSSFCSLTRPHSSGWLTRSFLLAAIRSGIAGGVAGCVVRTPVQAFPPRRLFPLVESLKERRGELASCHMLTFSSFSHLSRRPRQPSLL